MKRRIQRQRRRRGRHRHEQLEQIDYDDDDDHDHNDDHNDTTTTRQDGIFRDDVGNEEDQQSLSTTARTRTSFSNHKQSHSHPHPHPQPQYLDIEDAIERLGMGWFQYGVFLACGLCFASDSMEVLLLSFLAVVLQEEWNLTETQTDSIISVVFAGAMLGTLILSSLGDIWGRRPVFAVTAGLISLFGMATALCTNYTQLLVARFLVGFGVGGLTVPYDALGEVMGSSFRGKNLLSTSYFWTGGSLLVPLFAWVTIGGANPDEPPTTGSWRGFVILCAIPCVISTVLGVWLVPESPRYLVSKGKHERALGILRQAAIKNGKEPYLTYPEGTILVDGHATAGGTHGSPDVSSTDDSSDDIAHQAQQEQHPNQQPIHVVEEEKNCCYLFSSPRWRRISFLMSWQWFGLAFSYYGCIIAVSIVFSGEESSMDSTTTTTGAMDPDAAAASTTTNEADSGDDTTTGSYEFDYFAILISSSAEVVGLTLAILVIDRWGRVPTQTYTYFLGGLCVLILGFLDYYVGGGVEVNDMSTKTMNASSTNEGGVRMLDQDEMNEITQSTEQLEEERRHLVFFAFLGRLFIMAATSATWLHTAELLPTEVRATGHGLANAMGRIGGLLSPFIITESSSLRLIGIVMFGVSAMASICSYCLPETAGKALGDIVDSTTSQHNSSNNNEDFVVGELELTETDHDPPLSNNQDNTTPQPLSRNTTTTTTNGYDPESDDADSQDDIESYEIL